MKRFGVLRNRAASGSLWVLIFAIGGTMALSSGRSAAQESRPLTLKSAAFADNGGIPAEFTCEGENISPPLTWEGVPAKTQGLVLIVDDPDAPDPQAPQMTWVHWILFNLPSTTAGLPAGAASAGLPPGTQQGLNDWNKTGYGGPCPPVGRHRYFFKLYALDTVLKEIRPATKSRLEAAMQGHIIAKAELVGTYAKSR